MIGMAASQHEELGVTGPERPDWIGPNIPAWEDLEKLREHLVKKGTEISRPYWIIAMTCFTDPEILSKLEYGPHFEPTTPGACDESWTFLGYDVSDGSLLSGLSDCGYRDEDFIDKPRSDWAKRLNQNHLFDSLEAADAFRVFSDRKVIEHAPFLVYGLHLIEEVPGP